MDEETEEKFKALFKKRTDEQQAAKSAHQQRQEKETASQQRFIDHVRQVIKPALETLRALFSQQGIRSDVRETTDGPPVGNLVRVRVGLYVHTGDARMPRYVDPSDGHSLEFSFSAHDEMVHVYESRLIHGSGHSSEVGKFPINQITSKFIEE